MCYEKVWLFFYKCFITNTNILALNNQFFFVLNSKEENCTFQIAILGN